MVRYPVRLRRGSSFSGHDSWQYENGIHISDESASNLGVYTFIENNFIGTDITGTIALHNSGAGISGRASKIIDNLISGNVFQGITTKVPDGGLIIKGNKIGTDIMGTKVIGNGGTGLTIDEEGGDTAIIGGTNPQDANIIGGNDKTGIFLSGTSNIAQGISEDIIKIQGNFIGTDTSGTIDLGNGGSGITIPYNNDDLIGGRNKNEGNVIAFNKGNGVWLEDKDNLYGVNNGILGNRIYSNGKLGIELGSEYSSTNGISFNDAGDGDEGPNHFQNYPQFNDVTYDAVNNKITVNYFVPTSVNAATYPLRIEFFKSDSLDQPSQLLGVDTISAVDAEKQITDTFTPMASFSKKDFLIGTATDDGNNTSEQTPLWVTRRTSLSDFVKFPFLRSAIVVTPTLEDTNSFEQVSMRRNLTSPRGKPLSKVYTRAMEGYLYVNYSSVYKNVKIYFDLNDLKSTISDKSSLTVLWRPDPDSAWIKGDSTVFYPKNNPRFIGTSISSDNSAYIFPAEFRVVTNKGTPIVSTDTSINFYPDSISLKGRVKSNTSNTTAWFEWGKTKSYGNKTKAQTVPGNGSFIEVNSMLKNLSPGQTYHFSIAAQNNNGITGGLDGTFRLADTSNYANLYWVDHLTNSIHRSNLDGSNLVTLLNRDSGVDDPVSAAFDQNTRTIFWTDQGTGTIKKANLKNIDNVKTVKSGLNKPSGIAVNQNTQEIYWSETGSGIIAKCNYDGTGVDTVVTKLGKPTHIAMEMHDKQIYWVDKSTGMIGKSTFDGNNIDTLAENLSGAYDLYLDKANRKVYFTDSSKGLIYVLDFDANHVQEQYISSAYGATTPTALTMGKNFIYWSTGPDGKIQRKNLQTSYVNRLSSGSENVTDLFIVYKQAGKLTLFPAALNFGDVPKRGINAGSIMIINNSNKDIRVNGINVSGQYFGFKNISTPFTIASGDTQRIIVSFNPMKNGALSGKLNITAGNENRFTLHSDLSGNGVPAPFLQTNKDSLFAGVTKGLIKLQHLQIVNKGDADLNFNIPGIAAEKVITKSSIHNNVNRIYPANKKITKGAKDIRQGHRVVLNAGGPDKFGYTWIDSDEKDGPSFAWMDITSIGTHLSLGDDDDASVSLPYNFNFYGTEKNSLLIGSNGYITFGTNGDEYSNTEIPNSLSPNNLIAPFWEDLSPQNGDNVYYYNDSTNSRFIIQYNDVPSLSDDGNYTFQVVLYRSGTIMFQYKSMSGVVDNATVGIEDSAGTDGLQVAFNTSYIHDSLAVQIAKKPEWLSAAPTAGTITPGDTLNMEVKFDASKLDTGFYKNSLRISSNDPVNPELKIPADLIVVPLNSPRMNLIAGDVSTTMLPGDSVSTNADIINTGKNNLKWSISNNSNWFDIMPDSGTVSAGDSESVSLKILTGNLSPNLYFDTLDIKSNGVIHPEIKAPVELRIIDPDSVDFAMLLRVSDKLNNKTSLTFGTAKSATRNYDRKFDESASNQNQDWLYAKLTTDSLDLVSDFRSSSKTSIKWHLITQPALNANSITLKWNPARIPQNIKLKITDPQTGNELADMKKDSKYIMRDYGKVNISMSVIKTAVNGNKNKIPHKYFMKSNYPNPFNPSTTIKYGLPHQSSVKIVVYNVLGKRVKTLVNEVEPAGYHQVNFNADELASGVYFYRIEANNYVKTRKMLLLK